MVRIAIAFLLYFAGGAVAVAGPLHHAARNGDLERVRALIDAGADLDAQGDNGETALNTAILEGHVSVSSSSMLRSTICGKGRPRKTSPAPKVASGS